MKIGIEHIAIYAKDTKKLSDWYKNLFDGEIVYDNKKGTYFVAFSEAETDFHGRWEESATGYRGYVSTHL